VADFIGRANLIPGRVAAVESCRVIIDSSIGRLSARSNREIPVGSRATVCVRPEFIRVGVSDAGHSGNTFHGKVRNLVFIGEAYEAEIRINDTLLTTTIEPTARIAEGDDITVSFDPEHCFLLSD
jgi:iron(III) transport system ATP-binding protein